MTEAKTYRINMDEKIEFNNNSDYCIGTGRMGLALQKEYYEQLKMVQEMIGFKYIRGHGLFHDDMAIYQEYQGEDGNTYVEYNFTYLDMVMDNYISLNIRPFLELGFMPDKLASDKQTIFYWKGNTTPPKSYKAWTDLVVATLKHLLDRYGEEEVLNWPIEVWNEPNLRGFWKDADMPEYFKLYRETVLAVKELDSRFFIGGPAICGVEDDLWIRSFLEFCKNTGTPVDFITRHHYTIKLPERVGHYDYAELTEIEHGYSQLISTRNIIDSFEEYKDRKIHITEFNTSYSPKTPLHDTNCNAAYIAELLSQLGDLNESYSYWTFGDIFEEHGVPFTPFYGGFGLVANGCIKKPTFWTFYFYKQLKGKCVHRSKEAVIVLKDDGKYCGITWNKSIKRTDRKLVLNLILPSTDGSEYCLLKKIVDEKYCNPLKVWHDIGEPANPSREQLTLIREAANPLVITENLTSENDTISLNLELNEHAVVYFELYKINRKSDRGYDYKRVINSVNK